MSHPHGFHPHLFVNVNLGPLNGCSMPSGPVSPYCKPFYPHHGDGIGHELKELAENTALLPLHIIEGVGKGLAGIFEGGPGGGYGGPVHFSAHVHIGGGGFHRF